MVRIVAIFGYFCVAFVPLTVAVVVTTPVDVAGATINEATAWAKKKIVPIIGSGGDGEGLHVFYSSHNWAAVTPTPSQGLLASVNPGAYLKFNVTGQKSAPVLKIKPLLPPGPPAAGPPPPSGAKHYMNVIYSVDDGQFVELPVFENTTELVLGTGNLAANAWHDVVFVIYNSLQSARRWTNVMEPGGAALAVSGLQLDATAKLLPYARLAPKRCIFFGDSITEGVAAHCNGCRAGEDLCNNAATKTWGRTVAAALECEYSQVGFGALGWTVPGAGAVVPFYTPGQPEQSSWNQCFAGQPRHFVNSLTTSPSSSSGSGSRDLQQQQQQQQQVDYVFVLHATNDGLRQANSSAVSTSVHGWLGKVRAAVGPDTHVFLTIPFGGFGNVLPPEGALLSGFTAYRTEAPHDTNTHMIDLGRAASRGLTHFHAPTAEGCHGIHPRGGTTTIARHGELGAMLAVQAVKAMMAVTAGRSGGG